jgi:hypothetical protein
MTNDPHRERHDLCQEGNSPLLALPSLELPWATAIADEHQSSALTERRMQEVRRWRANVERAFAEEVDSE